MTKTKTVTKTEEVEVEMVECSSCGQMIDKDDARHFKIRNRKNRKAYSGYTNGWACEYCVSTQISFPVIYRGWLHDASAEDILLLIFLILILCAIPFVI